LPLVLSPIIPLDAGLTLIRTPANRASAPEDPLNNKIKHSMPNRHYARAVLRVAAPLLGLKRTALLSLMRQLWIERTTPQPATRRLNQRRQDLPTAQGPRSDPPHRAAAARARDRLPPRRRHAAARPQTVLLAARSIAVGADRPPDRPSVLDRHRRQFQPG